MSTPINRVTHPTTGQLRRCLRKELHIIKKDPVVVAFGVTSGIAVPLSHEECEALEAFLRVRTSAAVPPPPQIRVIKKILSAMGEKKVFHEELSPVESVLLVVTDGCNMSCSYCYGRYGARRNRTDMDGPTARKAVDVAARLGAKQVAFFGGEPLANLNAIRQFVEYAASEGHTFQYGMTTNGTLVTPDIARFCVEHNIRMAVSIDGPQDIHDMTRVYSDGTGTWSDVTRGIGILKAHGVLDVLEITHSARHPGNLAEIVHSLTPLCDRITCSCVEGAADAPYQRDIIRGQRMERFYTEMLDHLLDPGKKVEVGRVSGVVELASTITSPVTVQRKYICSGVMRRITVAPDGRVYPCPETMVDVCSMGSIWDAGFIEEFPQRRELALEPLKKVGAYGRYWFSGLVDTCIVRLRRRGDGSTRLDGASTVGRCLESAICRVVCSS